MPPATSSRGKDPASTRGGASSKSERTRERIVDATARVLNSRGYAGTRLSDIAAIAEVQAPAIYYYFSSREELVEEAVSVGLQRTMLLMREALDEVPESATPLQRIRVAVAAHLNTLLTHSEHSAAAVRTVAQLPQEMRDRQLTAHRAYIDVWRGLLEDARAAGEIDPDLDLRAALMIVLGALTWTVEWWDPDQGSLDRVIATAQSLIENGLSATAPSAA
ncbi:TetR/AcrR family transcriptional regulator [Actinomycetospora endophytica]|uniref:TetR/AcrR family transcriptional regulator n=1 Tax=Actinomycetospora endophytica TaxID=2291215 RepID=A0ABS8P8K4_9PSEU|nr:TetR/AcrR family transcriptional regulator [Actinomycetospora endophytica]MCD2194588.1 TetR/AcrR family transcriptional regulator [Actinomycetospora endophytica]